MVNIVVVSHSLLLAQGVAQLAQQMMHGDCRLAIAAGVDDAEHPIGTDAVKVMEAIESVYDPAGVVVLMDLGSALLSAETALELLDPAMVQRVVLCAAPLVEGTVAAVVAAGAGGDLQRVKAEALGALAAKSSQLGEPLPLPATAPLPETLPAEGQSVSWTVRNPHGLHVRPAARLAEALAPFDARLTLEKAGRRADPRSLNQLATLQIRQGETIRLWASGPQAAAALAAFVVLAQEGFGETLAGANDGGGPNRLLTGTPVPAGQIRAPVLQLRPVRHQARRETIEPGEVISQQRRLDAAIKAAAVDLDLLARRAAATLGDALGAIFRAHEMLLRDGDLIQAMRLHISRDLLCASASVERAMLAMAAEYQAMDDPYLRARELDIHDLLNRLLGHLVAEPVPPLKIAAGVILVAAELLPSEMIGLDRQNVKGIGLSGGNCLSHTAILARALGIPMLVGITGCLEATRTGATVVLDIAAGTLQVVPD